MTNAIQSFHHDPHYQGNISLRMSSNSEANASEFLENLEECFPLY